MKLGIDIGGTKTEVVAVIDGEVIHRATEPTGYGAKAVVESVLHVAEQVRILCDQPFSAFDSIGAGIPGRVDHRTGEVSHAVNLGFESLQLGSKLSDLMGAPVNVDNDVNAAALGAYRWLDPTNENTNSLMAYLNLGTGLAAGLVSNGAIWRGSNGVAGEIGHIPFQSGGALCPCGQRGCLETVASGSAISRSWPTSNPLPALALSIAAQNGEPRANDVLNDLYKGTAAAVRVLALAAGVGTVVIGGGLTALGPQLLTGIKRALDQTSSESNFIASLDLSGHVSLLPRTYPAAAVGASLIGSQSNLHAKGRIQPAWP
ncbi:ROK family protein [Pseudarthrobacter sp. PS3-L1]|uniref:ROK family protein n=1 Tax=Pseudarthrobacter sp. PS3-L1 TaxID=3046207 RepID=UPI0024B8969F|nr:ROK family protein [Pseudarthrobacter sp. PS3-L1]MDJ0318954.1 ROK family protein [Pseudarthrobacter sp. PS3-L1]